METLLLIAGGYLAVGVIAIGVLEITTKRVSGRIKDASMDTMQLTGESGKVALLVTVLALWVFWPAAIYAAIRR